MFFDFSGLPNPSKHKFDPAFASVPGVSNIPKPVSVQPTEEPKPEVSKTVSKAQMKTIIENRPDDVTPDEIVDTIIWRGYKIEGYEPPAETVKPEISQSVPSAFVQKESKPLDVLKMESSESFSAPELAGDIGKFFINLPADSAEVVQELATAALSPIDTITAALKTWQGLSDKAVYWIGNAIARQFGWKDVSPTEEAKMIDAIGEALKTQYGTAGKLKKAAVENPADVLLTLMGWLGVVKWVAETAKLTNVVDKITKLEQVVNPINVLKKEAEVIGNVTKTITGQLPDLKLPGMSKLPEDEALISSIEGKKAKALVGGQEIEIPVPKTWIIKGTVRKITTQATDKELAGRSIAPTVQWKTPKQKVNTYFTVESNAKRLWEGVQTGKFQWTLETLQDAAETVVNNIDSVGARIGELMKGAKWNVGLSDDVANGARSALGNKIEARSGAYPILQRFVEDLSSPLSVEDAFKAKRVYQNEIGKLIKAGDAGTESFQALVKGVQEITDGLETLVAKTWKGGELAEANQQYGLLKTLAKDIAQSAMVDSRKSPQTFTEQIGTIQGIVEGVRNPVGTAQSIFAREIGEMNTRGWSWKELMDSYARQAIKAAETGVKPDIAKTSKDALKKTVSK